ncbi:hypothetical protein ACJX0J_025312 [Zea mays]
MDLELLLDLYAIKRNGDSLYGFPSLVKILEVMVEAFLMNLACWMMMRENRKEIMYNMYILELGLLVGFNIDTFDMRETEGDKFPIWIWLIKRQDFKQKAGIFIMMKNFRPICLLNADLFWTSLRTTKKSKKVQVEGLLTRQIFESGLSNVPLYMLGLYLEEIIMLKFSTNSIEKCHDLILTDAEDLIVWALNKSGSKSPRKLKFSFC